MPLQEIHYKDIETKIDNMICCYTVVVKPVQWGRDIVVSKFTGNNM